MSCIFSIRQTGPRFLSSHDEAPIIGQMSLPLTLPTMHKGNIQLPSEVEEMSIKAGAGNG